MTKLVFSLLGLLVFAAIVTVNGQSRSVLDVPVEDLIKRFESKSDTIFVVNFWATWCLPCVKEIPEFNKIGMRHQNKPVKVIMANLDFPNQKESRLMPFLDKNEVKHEVVMTLTPRGGAWIEQVDEAWTGAIPATIVLHNGKRRFFEGEINNSGILEMMNTVIKQ
jgi:thiol-disulfide isomerase/thioredoxin